MLSAIEVYQDCSDSINAQENGQFSYLLFNRFSWRGQLRLLEWLSGDVAGVAPPEPYRTQKNRDWLSDFVVKFPVNVNGGIITRPADYYLYQDMYLLRGELQSCDEGEEMVIFPNKPITLHGNDKFYQLANTYIDRLRPTADKPIAKQVGTTYEFYPEDIGSMVLEYIRYPKRASITPAIDPVYNQEVPGTVVDFEWNENSREVLNWFICDAFSNRTREQAFKQFNELTGKVTRDLNQQGR